MQIRVLAFARVREVLGSGERILDVGDGSTAGDVWQMLCGQFDALRSLTSSTRIARNGRIASNAEPLREGDELALLPPAGGG